MADYRRLKVWKKAHLLALAIHSTTRSFAKMDGRDLSWQLNRAALSIPSNLAEGMARSSARERARFVEIALSSAFEVDYQLLFAVDAGYIRKEKYEELYDLVTAVKRMLSGLLRGIRSSTN